jgi:GH24 family phage-related lysozyme (muramidase)
LVRPECFPHGISETKAAQVLTGDLLDAEMSVTRLVRVALTQGQFDALVDFCFNVGMGKLAASTLLKYLNAGEYGAAADESLQWAMLERKRWRGSRPGEKRNSSFGMERERVRLSPLRLLN